MTANDVSRAPQGWRPEGAFTFPELWWAVEAHRSPSLPITPAIFIAISFEETACCNLMQGSTPVAAGPAQLQVSDDDKVQFFAGSDGRENFMGGRWDASQTTWASDIHNKVFKRATPTYPELHNPLSIQYIMSNNEFSVKMHLKYFQWLMNGYGRNGEPVGSLGGLMRAQTGGGKNAKAGPLFAQGGPLEPVALLEHQTVRLSIIVPPDEDALAAWLDHEYMAQIEAIEEPEPTLEEVHRALSKIPGNLSDDIRSEREARG